MALWMGELRARPQRGDPLGGCCMNPAERGGAQAGAEMERRGCFEKKFRRLEQGLETGWTLRGRESTMPLTAYGL